MAKKVFHNGRTVHLQFSNDMDKYGAEYDMNTLSKLLDEDIPLDELKQQLKEKKLKNSRKRIVNNKDELIIKKQYHPNESVEVDHLFNLDKNYNLTSDADYKHKYHSKRKLNKEEKQDENGITLNTSAGTIHLNNELANKYANGKKRLKIKNQYVSSDKLLNFSDDYQNLKDNKSPCPINETLSGFNHDITALNDNPSDLSIISEYEKKGNSMNNIIDIPVRDRSTNKNHQSSYQINLNNYKNNDIKKQFPYGELALPSNGKTVTENNYESDIDWEKAICSKYGCNKNIDNVIVPEKYYQSNQNVPRTADEWENLSNNGDNRFKEKLPNANITSEHGPSISIKDEDIVFKDSAIIENKSRNLVNIIDNKLTKSPENFNNTYYADKLYNSNWYKEFKTDFNSIYTNPNIDPLDNITPKVLENTYRNNYFTLKYENKPNENIHTFEGIPNAIPNLTDKNESINIDTTKAPTFTLNKDDNMNQYSTPDEDGFIQIKSVGNGVNYSPRMHNIDEKKPGVASVTTNIDPSIFDQKKIHEQQLKEFGEYTPTTQKDVIIEAKNHQGMTAAIALSVKIRDLKELVTEFSKNVNKIDHCIYDQMNDTVFRMLKNAAKIKRRTHHKTTLYELDTDIEFFRDLIKLAVKLQYMSPKKGLYGRCVSLIDELGAICGGFIKRIDQFENKKKK